MESFKSLQDEISKALVATTRSATRISGADISFQRSLNPDVGTALDTQNARLLHLAQRLLANAAASSDAVGPKLPDVDAIDGDWRGVVDVIDSLLEKADTSLDEYTGVVKRLSPSADPVCLSRTSSAARRLTRIQAAAKPRPNIAEKKHITKPQLEFDHVPTNDETGGFRPLLQSKPHARVPMEQCLKTFRDSRDREQYVDYHTAYAKADRVVDTPIRTSLRSNPTNTLQPCMNTPSPNTSHPSNPLQPSSSKRPKHSPKCWQS